MTGRSRRSPSDGAVVPGSHHQPTIDRSIDHSSRPIGIPQPGKSIRRDVYLVTVSRLNHDRHVRRVPNPGNHLPKAKLSLHRQRIPAPAFCPEWISADDQLGEWSVIHSRAAQTALLPHLCRATEQGPGHGLGPVCRQPQRAVWHIVIRTGEPVRQSLCWHFDVEPNEMAASAVVDEGIQIPVIIERHRCMLPRHRPASPLLRDSFVPTGQ